MKIALITGSLGEQAGGITNAVRALAEGLADRGLGVSIFALQLGDTFGPNQLPENPAIRCFVEPCFFHPRTRFTWAPRFQRKLTDYCQREGIQLLHANGVWLASTRITAGVARSLNLPFIVSPHGHLQPWAMGNKALKKKAAWVAYARRALATANIIQAASEHELASIRCLGLEQPVAEVPNGVQIPEQMPPPMDTGDDLKTVLFLSRIHPSKGLLDLVEAWDSLRPDGWRVVVAGYDENNHLAEVRAMVRSRNLDAAFSFVGPVREDKWPWFRRADLYVLPTYSENFGVAIAEALAAGLPVVTTRAAPWRDLVTEDCGWWCEPGAAALTKALAAAISLSDKQRAAMGARGAALVRGRYTIPAVAATMESVYSCLVHPGGPYPDCIHTES